MAAPPGWIVGLTYDSPEPCIPERTFIRTRTGRTYLVTSVRIQERGKHAGRQHLRAEVCPPDVVLDDDADVRELWWYRRG